MRLKILKDTGLPFIVVASISYNEILLRSSKHITLKLFFKGLLGVVDMKYVDKLMAGLPGIELFSD